MYILILYDAELVDYGFYTYTVRGEGLLSEVEELFTHLIMTHDYESSVAAAKSVAYREGLRVNEVHMCIVYIVDDIVVLF